MIRTNAHNSIWTCLTCLPLRSKKKAQEQYHCSCAHVMLGGSSVGAVNRGRTLLSLGSLYSLKIMTLNSVGRYRFTLKNGLPAEKPYCSQLLSALCLINAGMKPQ